VRTLGLTANPRRAAFLIRASLTFVFCAWAYDIQFNPAYYAHVLHGLTVPAMVALFALAASFVAGWGTRYTGALAAGLLIVFGISLEGHQPIGLPQNAGLAGAAMALTLIGPGAFALGQQPRRIAKRDLLVAGWLIRLGLCVTFLVYGFYKFAAGDEYRIVVAEAPIISAVARLLGAQTTVGVVGIAEFLLALLMLPGFGRLWGALFQVFALGSFLFALGYPFSYPQDLGLIGVIAGFACLQTIALPLSLRRGHAGLLRRVAFDQRAIEPAPSLSGAVVVVRVAGSTIFGFGDLASVVRGAVRPTDLLAPTGRDGYCVLLDGIDSPQALEVVLFRLRRALAPLATERVVIGSALWSSAVPLAQALQRSIADASFEDDVQTPRRAA